MPSLGVWMNGERVGEWATLRGGTPVLRYAESWVGSPRARALSLSLPITADRQIRGPVVENYFDNLLPDSAEIRRRIRSRFGTASTGAFDLLAAIGRDCVGAVQLLPPDEEPDGWDRIAADPLTEAEVEQQLRSVTATTALGLEEREDFRISLAGAQEKTALLSMGHRWFRPTGATPTTHILKLPLGVIGNFRGDFSDSVENEWLCAQFLRELALPVADVELGRFGEERTLIVTRFDRRWIGVEAAEAAKTGFEPTKGMWLARLPQEDFCQALGLAPTLRYQADGGPAIRDCLTVLATSENPDADRARFVLSQLAFWLLAATDGHAKNFSLHQHAGGGYGLTPLYDVLSAWPIIGGKRNQLPLQKAKLAMGLPGQRVHYRLMEISTRNWQELATHARVPSLWPLMQSFVDSASAALERLEARLPRGFPARLYESISQGVHAQARRFSDTTSSPRL